MFPSGRERRNLNPVNLVVWIAFPSTAAMQVRKNFYSKAEGKNATLGPPGTDDEPNKFMGVNAWAPVFANREAVQLARSLAGSLANEKCHVYTSINAARTTDANGKPLSQAAFEAQHILLGLTTDGSQITYGDPAQEEERVGVIVHGLASTVNWGWNVFSPCMPITYKFPAVKLADRKRELDKRKKAMTPDFAGDDTDMRPLLREWQPYAEYIASAQTGVSVFLGSVVQNQRAPDYSAADFMQTDRLRTVPQYEDETLEMKALGAEIAKMSQSFGLTMLAVLLTRGEIVPAEGVSSLDYLQDLCDRLFGSANQMASADFELVSQVLSAQLGPLYVPPPAAEDLDGLAPPPLELPVIFSRDEVPVPLERLRLMAAKGFLEITGRLHADASNRLLGRAASFARPGDKVALYL